MKSRASIVVGFAAGVLVAIALIGGIVALSPDPSGPPSVLPTPIPTPAATPTAAPTEPTAGGSPTSGPLVTAFRIGEPAPPLVVPQVGGGTIDLGALAGKPVWVNFMGTYCPECVEEFPRMNGFAARYADNGLIVIAVDVREEEGVVAPFVQSLNATFPVGLDLDGSVAAEWGAIALPVHFWIDAEGIVRDGALGGVGPDLMARGLSRILPDVEVTP